MPGGAKFVPGLIHNRSYLGSYFDVDDLNTDGTLDIVTSGPSGFLTGVVMSVESLDDYRYT